VFKWSHCPAGDACIAERGPRIEKVIEPESTTCACGAERHIIGEDTSEPLDIIPAQFRVIVTHLPKYTCRSCEERGWRQMCPLAIGEHKRSLPVREWMN